MRSTAPAKYDFLHKVWRTRIAGSLAVFVTLAPAVPGNDESAISTVSTAGSETSPTDEYPTGTTHAAAIVINDSAYSTFSPLRAATTSGIWKERHFYKCRTFRGKCGHGRCAKSSDRTRTAASS